MMTDRARTLDKGMLGVAFLVCAAVLVAYVVLLAASAGAQTNDDPLMDTATVTTIGTVNGGDVITIDGGPYTLDPTATVVSVTLSDGDGTVATFTDGVNAEITANGVLTITVTSDPTIVTPGSTDGLSTTGLTVEDSEGILPPPEDEIPAPSVTVAPAVGVGDELTIEGNCTLQLAEDGVVSVTLEDEDGTVATFTNEGNATIVVAGQQLTITVDSDPAATGGTGGLSTTGLTVQDSEGITCANDPTTPTTDTTPDDTTDDDTTGDDDTDTDTDDTDTDDTGDDDVINDTIPDQNLPDTGGPAIFLPAGALLMASGIMGYAIVRRRS